MPTPQQLLAQAGRKPQDLSRANAATGTLQGAHGGTQHLGAPAQRRLAQQAPELSKPVAAPAPPPPQVSEELQSLTGGGLQAPMMNAAVPGTQVRPLPPDLAQVQGLDVMGITPGTGVGGHDFNLPGFKPLNGQPLETGLPAPDFPGAAMGARMPPGAGKFPPQGGSPAAGWSVGGPPAPGGGPDVRPPGLLGFKPAGGMLSKPVAPGLPGGDPPQSPDSFGGGKPRQLPFRRNGVTDVGRNSMAGF